MNRKSKAENCRHVSCGKYSYRLGAARLLAAHEVLPAKLYSQAQAVAAMGCICEARSCFSLSAIRKDTSRA